VGEAERLPEVIYVQGFIRRYGDFLGLEGNALAHQLTRTPSLTPDDLTPEMVALPVAPEAKESLGAVPRDRSSRVPNHKMRSENPLLLTDPIPKRNLWAQLSPYWLYLLVLLAAIAGLYSLFVRPPSPPTPSSATSTQNETPPAPEPVEPTGTISPVPSSRSPVTPKPLEAKVELLDEAWLRVEADGKKVYEGVLSKGSAQTWSASKTLKIRSGNAGAVNLSVNQTKAKPLGNLGEVKEVVIDSQSQRL
jgi:cytoskeletal protein RodZ